MNNNCEEACSAHWMELIHPGLPALVKRTFAFDLQRMPLKDLQPQICDAIDGFLKELKHEDVKVSRAWVQGQRYQRAPTATAYAIKPEFYLSQRPELTCRGRQKRV